MQKNGAICFSKREGAKSADKDDNCIVMVQRMQFRCTYWLCFFDGCMYRILTKEKQ